MSAQIFILINAGKINEYDSLSDVPALLELTEIPTEPIIEPAESAEKPAEPEEYTESVTITVSVTVPVETTEEKFDEKNISKDVPVFMYHTSSENNPGSLAELYVKPSEFEKQIVYLTENGFTFCTFDDYDNLNNINKPVFITFDDGYLENYTEIYPIVQKYNAKITIFLMLNHVRDSNITWDMVVEMSDSGLVKFESHTVSHPSLSSVSSDDARLTEELKNSKQKIEEMTGKPVIALAYPNGEFNQIVKEKTSEYYSFGLRKDLGMHNTDYDRYEVRRIRLNRSANLETFIKLLG